MRKFIIIFFSLILANCSLNKDSQYWTENTIESKTNQKKLNEIPILIPSETKLKKVLSIINEIHNKIKKSSDEQTGPSQ